MGEGDTVKDEETSFLQESDHDNPDASTSKTRGSKINVSPDAKALPVAYKLYAESMKKVLSDVKLDTPVTLGVMSSHEIGRDLLMESFYRGINDACNATCDKVDTPPEPKVVKWKYNIVRERCPVSLLLYLIIIIIISVGSSGAIAAGLGVAVHVYGNSTENSTYNNSTEYSTYNNSTENSRLNASTEYSRLDNSLFPKHFFWQRLDIVIPVMCVISVLCILLFLVVVVLCKRVCFVTCKYRLASSSAGICYHLQLILVMLLCNIPKPPKSEQDDVELLPVIFQAWEYSGSDNLWAAIVMHLCKKTEKYFGLAKSRLYRKTDQVLQHEHSNTQKDPESGNTPDDTNPTCGDTQARTDSTVYVTAAKPTWCPKIPYHVLIAIVISILVTLLPFVISMGIELKDQQTVRVILAEAVTGCILVSSLLLQARNIYRLVKSLTQGQASRIATIGANNENGDFRSGLGYMKKVKDEVKTLMGFIRTMECLYRKRFRLCLVINDLEYCSEDTVYGVLETMRLLISDSLVPIILILNINHDKVKRMLDKKEIDSSTYLAQMVNLKFFLPETSLQERDVHLKSEVKYARDMYRAQILRTGIPTTLGFKERVSLSSKELGTGTSWKRQAPDNVDSRKSAQIPTDGLSLCLRLDDNTKRSSPTVGSREFDEIANSSEGRKNLAQGSVTFLNFLVMQTYEKYRDIVGSNYDELRCLHRSIRLTIHIWTSSLKDVGFFDNVEFPEGSEDMSNELCWTCRELAWWILLCEYWPYRMSWIVASCINDEESLRDGPKGVNEDGSDPPGHSGPTGASGLAGAPGDKGERGDDVGGRKDQSIKDAWTKIVKDAEHRQQVIGKKHDKSYKKFREALDKFGSIKMITVRRFLPFTLNIDRSLVQKIAWKLDPQRSEVDYEDGSANED